MNPLAGVQDDAGQAQTITRPEQVLSEYGMTCYGTSVMFITQSYALVPPDMTREEFEFAFTPLNPKSPGHAKTDSIEVTGKPIPKIKSVGLITRALEGALFRQRRKPHLVRLRLRKRRYVEQRRVASKSQTS